MNAIKRAIWGPDPAEQKRKCLGLVRKNQRELDKQLNALTALENKTKTMLRASAKRNDIKIVRMLAKEVCKVRKQCERLHKSKAQLNSVSLRVNEAFALRKIEGTMRSSTSVMKDVNTLVRMPELMGTMMVLGQELVKLGIIDEMVEDTLEAGDELDESLEDEEIERQVAAIIQELAQTDKDSKPTTVDVGQNLPPVPESQPTKTDDEDLLLVQNMRERLKALQG